MMEVGSPAEGNGFVCSLRTRDLRSDGRKESTIVKKKQRRKLLELSEKPITTRRDRRATETAKSCAVANRHDDEDEKEEEDSARDVSSGDSPPAHPFSSIEAVLTMPKSASTKSSIDSLSQPAALQKTRNATASASARHGGRRRMEREIKKIGRVANDAGGRLPLMMTGAEYEEQLRTKHKLLTPPTLVDWVYLARQRKAAAAERHRKERYGGENVTWKKEKRKNRRYGELRVVQTEQLKGRSQKRRASHKHLGEDGRHYVGSNMRSSNMSDEEAEEEEDEIDCLDLGDVGEASVASTSNDETDIRASAKQTSEDGRRTFDTVAKVRQTATIAADIKQRMKDRGQDWIVSTSSSLTANGDALGETAIDTRNPHNPERIAGGRGRRLRGNQIEICQLPNANQQAVCGAAVQSVKFHPRESILLTAGYDKTLRLFKVDGVLNPKMASAHLCDFPISEAIFTPNGQQVVALSPFHKTVVEYDVETGSVEKVPGIAGNRLAAKERYISFCCRDDLCAVGVMGTGAVLICDTSTKRLIRSVKMNAPVTAVAFHPTENVLITTDNEAHVYEWDVGTGRCLHNFQELGSLSISSLATSCPPSVLSCVSNRPPLSTQRLVAAGSRTGYVSLFSLQDSCQAAGMAETPLKTFGNLTTAVTSLCFHPSDELMCMASRWKERALKLVHLPSMTVYSNWPTFRTPLRCPTAVAFSPSGGMLAVGNETGEVLLYKLRHFWRH